MAHKSGSTSEYQPSFLSINGGNIDQTAVSFFHDQEKVSLERKTSFSNSTLHQPITETKCFPSINGMVLDQASFGGNGIMGNPLPTPLSTRPFHNSMSDMSRGFPQAHMPIFPQSLCRPLIPATNINQPDSYVYPELGATPFAHSVFLQPPSYNMRQFLGFPPMPPPSHSSTIGTPSSNWPGYDMYQSFVSGNNNHQLTNLNSLSSTDLNKKKRRKKGEGDDKSTSGSEKKTAKKARVDNDHEHGPLDPDARSRRNNMAYAKGTFLIRLSDSDNNDYGDWIWLVDNYQLIQKCTLERRDSNGVRYYTKTERYSGWLADEPWLYYPLYNIELELDPNQPIQQLAVLRHLPTAMEIELHKTAVYKQRENKKATASREDQSTTRTTEHTVASRSTSVTSGGEHEGSVAKDEEENEVNEKEEETETKRVFVKEEVKAMEEEEEELVEMEEEPVVKKKRVKTNKF